MKDSDVTPDTTQADPHGPILRLSLDAFEGPLDLLLHLIRKHTLNIFDIPIAFVTDEYLRYLDDAADKDLGVAGEYLVMAATLLQIKSAMLLPQPEKPEDEEDAEDPREALIQRLLAYQSYKDAANALADRTWLFRDVFPRPEAEPPQAAPRTLHDIDPPSIFDLVEAYRSLVKKKENPPMHEVTRHELSIKDSVLRIARFLDHTPRTTFETLAASAPHQDPAHRAVITFMGLLEMAKLRLLTLFQTRLRGDALIVERAVIRMEEIALELDFSDATSSDDKTVEQAADAQVVQTPAVEASPLALVQDDIDDTDDVDEIHEDSDLEELHETDPIVLKKREELRGRPRFKPFSYSVEELAMEDELFALNSLHADMDTYDLDAVLAQALQLSKATRANMSPSTAPPTTPSAPPIEP